jgi:nicotinamidase-related amidase
MSAREPVLVLIDCQEGFHDAAFWGPRNNPDAESNVARLLAAWRGHGLPVIHVRHASQMKGSPLAADQPGHQFIDVAAPTGDEAIITKSVNSAFIGTHLEALLNKLGRPPIVVAGITTDHCVSSTVRMAANLGFAVVLAGDACFTFDREDPSGHMIAAEDIHQANLASLHREFADVRPTVRIVADLGGCVQPRPR